MSDPGPVMEWLGHIAFEIHRAKPLIPTYLHLLVSAIFPIYAAAHASLARPSSAAPSRKKKGESTDQADSQDEEISPTIETLTPSDAILFPILAGITLVSLYFILKWLQDPALLNYYLGLYFAVIGLYFNVQFVRDGLATIRSVILPSQYSYRGQVWKLKVSDRAFAAADQPAVAECRTSPLPAWFSIFFQQYNSSIWSLRGFLYTRFDLKFSVWKIIGLATRIDILDLIGLVIATPVVYYHTFIDKPWVLTNILGFSFCYGALQITTPGTVKTGSLLLCALFFYDIYFVFFTPMMVTVATELDIPIKLLFPRPDGCVFPAGAEAGSQAMKEYLLCKAKKITMAMLGLGDIVIPGMMLAFALRFDLYLYYRGLAKSDDKAAKVPYLPATGLWGERLWTSTRLWSPELQAKRFPKTYFTASVIGYVMGMVATMAVMQVTQHAQPALLYLVPGVLVSLMGTAAVRGDFKNLWSYSEMPEEGDQDAKSKDIGNHKDSKDKKGDAAKSMKATENQPHVKKSKSEKTLDQPNHLILFSLSIVSEQKQPAAKKSQQPKAPPQDKPPAEEKQETDTDEFSADDTEDEDSEQELQRANSGVTTRSQLKVTQTSVGLDTESAVKKRRKA